jgi:HK97 family phage prohead protease
MRLTDERIAELRARHGGERRLYVPTLEARAESGSDGAWTLFGHAAVFERKSDPIPTGFGGSFREVVKRGAFRDVLDENQDVVVLWNHDMRWLLGRTGNQSFTVRESPRGLEYRGTPAPTTYAADLRVLLDRGDISQSSFGFTVKQDRWTETQQDNGDVEVLREILKIDRLYDVSPVAFPAYPQTDAGARSIVVPASLRATSAATPDLEDDAEDDESLAEDLSEAIEALADLLADDLDLFQSAKLSQPIADVIAGLSALLAEHVDDPVADDDSARAAGDEAEHRNENTTAEGEPPAAELEPDEASSSDLAADGSEGDPPAIDSDELDGERDGRPTVADRRRALARIEFGV